MLIKCPECELQVSDKATSCPHCGYPLKEQKSKNINRKPNKRRRLPNGFGQITEIKNRNLRKPFRASVTIGFNSKGRPICKLLKPESYFETYNDAYMALVEYNKSPYDLDSDITVSELYKKWTEEYFKSLKSDSSSRTIKSAWAYCHSIYDMRVKDIRARHIKGCMDNGYIVEKGNKKFASAGTKSRIKSLFNLMLDYALEYEMVDKNYSRTFSLSDDIIDEKEKAKNGHIPFSDEEIKKLWENINDVKYVDIVLFQCYSGWRPQELGLIELKNVDLDNDVIVGGMKTAAGKERIVPIHPKVKNIVEKYYKHAVSIDSKYLFNCTDATTHKSSYKMTYDKYRHRLEKIVKVLNLNPEHRPHDGRKHFVTMAKKNNVDEYAIKYIVGHSITDITEKVYTERNIEWLKEEIAKIK